MTKKEMMIDLKLFREYFEYLSPTDMYKNLNKPADSEENEAQVDTIKDRFPYLMEKFKSNSTTDAKKINNRNNMFNIVELILEFNQLNHAEKA